MLHKTQITEMEKVRDNLLALKLTIILPPCKICLKNLHRCTAYDSCVKRRRILQLHLRKEFFPFCGINRSEERYNEGQYFAAKSEFSPFTKLTSNLTLEK